MDSRASTFTSLETFNKPLPARGERLKRNHVHSYIIIGWICCLVAYLVAAELALIAHRLVPGGLENERLSFGDRGSRQRQNTVQVFNVARTILTVVHVPIITATLATTLPGLTQKMKGGNAPALNLEQLFLLADKTWAGAGGWFEALRVGNLSWQWWKYTLLVLVSFAGFPIATMGYLTVSEQYWGMEEVYLPNGLAVRESITDILGSQTASLQAWMDTMEKDTTISGYEPISLPIMKDAGGGQFSFYPAATPAFESRGHFVTFLNPTASGGLSPLVVADTMGILHQISCTAPKTPSILEATPTKLECLPNANCTSNLCHQQTSQTADHDILSCTSPSNSTLLAAFTNPLFTLAALELTIELAIRNRLTASISLTQCHLTLVPGNGIVDSVIRQYMHFLPFGLGLTEEPPTLLPNLRTALPLLLNASITPALTLLHRNPTRFLPQLPQLATTFQTLANSSFITALPHFFAPEKTKAFAYKTDVKLVRGFIPVGIAPIALLTPVLIAAYISISGWKTSSWTGFLDAFAMFRLGRGFEEELKGFGAVELKDCFVAKRIPGWVGDAGGGSVGRYYTGPTGLEKEEYVGEIRLGGGEGLTDGARYA